MTTREQRREEYSSSNVVRVLSPTTHGHQFDHNLDNLLEDLQASVSRPGSSLGQPIANYSSSREVQYLQPANVTTVARERSLSPSLATNERKVYKTAKYEYKSSSGGGNVLPGAGRADQSVSEVYQRNINQLDTLLNDLERERDSSLDRSKYPSVHTNAMLFVVVLKKLQKSSVSVECAGRTAFRAWIVPRIVVARAKNRPPGFGLRAKFKTDD
ncbi:AGAP006184-PA-like protein [Anopheles sinensis]|uniref:AGAP006184-PA-like protein n=1 Tax=Anopheles sinensis TaxID=74873 RepID=A0A084WL43_ANOSI|nr:AGAP006184-PA-like protein [Anopheles sinensis]